MYDDNQLKCINNLTDNLGVTACAGAGKTSTTVGRLINILQSGKASPNEVVAITFTEKAAGEFKERIFSKYESLTGNLHGLSEIKVGTIHSFCLETLKEYFPEYRKYDIISDIQAKLLMKKEFNNKNIFSTIPYKTGTGNKAKINSNKLKPYIWNDLTALLNTFNFIREECINPNDLNSGLSSAYAEYINLLENNLFFDYSGIQNEFYHSLVNNNSFRNYIAEQIKFIFIDEYQDVNTIQNLILQELHLINPEINICVVGDDDQLIYNWRGSNVDNFLDFENQFSGSVNETLNINYRSSEGIVKTAESVVKANKKRFDKRLDSNKTYQYEQGDIISKHDFDNITKENSFIVEAIEKLKGSILTDKEGNSKTIGYDDMAILVYSPGKLRDFNPELLNMLDDAGIPYIIEGTKKLLEQEEVIEIIKLFYYFINNLIGKTLEEYDEEYGSLQTKTDIFSVFNVSDEMWDKLNSYFLEQKKKFFASDTLNFYDFTLQDLYQNIIITLDLFNLSETEENERILYNLASFSTIIDDFEKIYFRSIPKNRLYYFLKFLKHDVNNVYPEGWLTPNFLQNKCLRIMSIHKSKGLEFPVVFMPHLCEQYLFPPASGGGRNEWGILEADNQIEIKDIKNRYKEKNESLNRLFYVGVTRSKKYLFMTKSNEYEKPGCKRAVHKMPKPYALASNSPYVNYNVDIFLNKEFRYQEESNEHRPNKMVFDFTTINDFFECPHKFKLNSIMGFKPPMNVRMGYGKSLHNILEHIHKTYANTGKILNEKKDIEKLVDNYLHLPHGNHMKQLVKDMKKSAMNVISNYLNTNADTFRHIELVEQRVDFKMNDSVFVNGRVDLVKNNKSGEIIVVDFKSSDDALSTVSKNAQLKIYALGYYEFTGKIPTAIHSYSLNNKESSPSSVTLNDLKTTKDKIMELHDKISNNIYEKAATIDRSKCNHCDYENSCNK
ncbi:ATP-dependent helicase [Bacillus solimangrovi]|uniref:DNA 3'-5' helicase n=1 Tax=Bacillus solimangrovi TaxID=1305675 RepID=A0A1E5LET4_9BACI|nr:ATP-dependent DNA helicase [Bacillus solimangrovi]OEH92572.1 hypothetical protein BFG57_15280 [Bacillus solimangrovi]